MAINNTANNTGLLNNQTQRVGQVTTNTARADAVAFNAVTNNQTQQNNGQGGRFNQLADATRVIGTQAQTNVNQLNGTQGAAQQNVAQPRTAAAETLQHQQANNLSQTATRQARVQAQPQAQQATQPVQAQRAAYVDPYGVQLTNTQQTLLRDLYVSDHMGHVPDDYTFSVRDWYYGSDNKLGVGDVLLVRNGAGQVVDYQFMNQSDIYNINYRESLVNNVNQVGKGWGFTPDLVDMPNNKLDAPVERYYWSGYGYGKETLVAQNDYWDIVERNGNKMMVQRYYDDQGRRINASDAIRDVFNNPQDYAFDCATPMPLLNMKTTLDVIGDADFNQRAGQLLFSSWYDKYDNSYFDGGYNIDRVSSIGAGQITVNNRENLEGEMGMFDPAKGDKLVLGGVYYFEKPGDNTSALQGWNTVYLGANADGSHRFWATSIGAVDVNFRDGSYITSDTNSAFRGHYLGSANIGINHNRLSNWDSDGSGAWRY